MSQVPPHCSACPLSDHAACPSIRHPSWCKNAERERRQPDPRQHYWLEAICREAEKIAGEVVAVKVPPGFPARPDPSDARVRVGVISPSCFLGGADIWVGDLLASTDHSRIHWVGAAVRDSGLTVVPKVREMWERHTPVAVGHEAIRALAASSDVIVAWGVHHSWGFPAEMLAGLVGDTRLICVSHGSEGRHLVPSGGRLAGYVPAAVSRVAKAGLPEEDRANASVILNRISPERIKREKTVEAIRKEWGVPEGARIAGWLSRVAHEKHPEVFVEAVGLLPDGWVGVIAGLGYALEQTRQLAAQVAPGRIVFLGERHDIGDCLATFDNMCMPTDSEACSLSAGEAWLAGCPLISTAVGLLEDHPDLARIIPGPPDARSLAEAILADHADADGTAERVGRARLFAEREMGDEKFGKAWTELICSAAPPRPVPKSALARGPGMGTKAVVRPEIARELAIYKEIRECRFRTGPACGCSGSPATCHRPDQAGRQVYLPDCKSCISSETVNISSEKIV